eukprot:242424-Chlamydomonas_euryale.AAC.3
MPCACTQAPCALMLLSCNIRTPFAASTEGSASPSPAHSCCRAAASRRTGQHSSSSSSSCRAICLAYSPSRQLLAATAGRRCRIEIRAKTPSQAARGGADSPYFVRAFATAAEATRPGLADRHTPGAGRSATPPAPTPLPLLRVR